MKAKPECLICTLKQVLFTASRSVQVVERQAEILRKAMAMLAKQDLEITPAELASDFFHFTCAEIGNPDPFRPEMDRYNEQGLRMIPYLQKILAQNQDRIYTAILMAVAGNLIDLGLIAAVEIDETLAKVLKNGLEYSDYQNFRQDLGRAKLLLYITDNAGEIVFDRILLEEIKKDYPKLAIQVAVKKGPAMNDALASDAAVVGLDRLGRVIETGADDLGIPLRRCSPEFWRCFQAADLVIAKGHANYETIPGGHSASYAILRVKCQVVADDLGAQINHSVLKKIV